METVVVKDANPVITKLNEVIKSLLSSLKLGRVHSNFVEKKCSTKGVREFKSKRGEKCLIKGYNIKGGDIDDVHQVFPCMIVKVKSNDQSWTVELISCCHYYEKFNEVYENELI